MGSTDPHLIALRPLYSGTPSSVSSEKEDIAPPQLDRDDMHPSLHLIRDLRAENEVHLYTAIISQDNTMGHLHLSSYIPKYARNGPQGSDDWAHEGQALKKGQEPPISRKGERTSDFKGT